MTVACPSCGRTAEVPPDKAGVPNLKARCRCGTVYAVTAAAPPPATPKPPTPKPPTPSAVVPGPVPPDAAPRAPSRPPPWPRCANHPQLRSVHVCPRCVKGYCDECVQKVQGGAICASCDGLCVPAAGYGQKQDTAKDRERSIWSYLGTIASYPFRDALGFALLAVFVWLATFAPTGIGGALLMVYSFHALTRVSNGDLKSFTPDIADPGELWEPARLAFAAFVISTGPLLAVMFFVPGAGLEGLMGATPTPAVHAAQPVPDEEADPPEAEERSPEDGKFDDPDHPGNTGTVPLEDSGSQRGTGAIALLALTLLWKLVYTPVAFTVAALSRSIMSTINPVIGISTIASMGVVYWQCLVIYTVLALTQWTAAYLLDPIPIAGALVRAFTDSYLSLAIACTLGLGVFKKAAALGWD